MHVSRRAVLAAAALFGCAEDAVATSPLYITPEGGGDGTSWDNAASLSELERLIRIVEPGGQILVAADRGEFALPEVVELKAGGHADRIIRVRGVSSTTGDPMPAILRGLRAEGVMGNEAFRLLRGANHLHFAQFDFRGFGNGCFRVGGPVSGIVIEDCAYEDIYRFLENTTSDGQPRATFRDFILRRCRGAQTERGFSRIRYDARDGLFEDCHAQGRANEAGDIPAGCALDGRASAITYRRCIMENFQQWRAGDYWNGDGFSDEPGNADIRYEACEARGSTDGGFDCKSRGVVLENCVAEDNKRNFRVWSERATLTGCTSRNPNFRGAAVESATACHIWIGAEREDAEIAIANLTIEDSDSPPIFQFDHDEPHVSLRGVTIRSPRTNWGENPAQVRRES